MVFYAAFNSISVISRRQLTLFMLSWVSPVLGWGYEVSCPRTLPRKNPEDPVRLESRTPGLRVKHILNALEIVVCNLFQFGTVKNFIVWKWVKGF